jgi:hypothetical protein
LLFFIYIVRCTGFVPRYKEHGAWGMEHRVLKREKRERRERDSGFRIADLRCEMWDVRYATPFTVYVLTS